MICSALAPLSERKKITVFSSAPIALSWSSTRPISRSMRSTIAAWMAILRAGTACCSSRQALPGDGPADFARADLLAERRLRQIPIADQTRGSSAESPQWTIPIFRMRVMRAAAAARPSPRGTVAVAGDVFCRGLQREVRRGEGQVREERLVRVFLGVLVQTLDRVLGNGRGGVVAAACGNGGNGRSSAGPDLK